VNTKTPRQDNVLRLDTTGRVTPRGVGRKTILLVGLLAFWLGSLPVSAQTTHTNAVNTHTNAVNTQTNVVKPSNASNRYLLVVEMSRGTKSRSDGVFKAVQALLGTGLGGQARRGDTIGLWTYNDDVYSGGLPLQKWSPEGVRSIVGKTMNFLTDQKFEKSGRLEKVMPLLQRVIGDSEYITVILVTDGSQKFQGTPFDDPINASYKSWRTEQQDAHMPFITVLRAKRGKLTDYTVNPAQWPLDMPPLPPELVPVEPKPAPVVAKAAPPVGPSLYLYGKTKSNTPLPPEARPPAETPTPPAATETLSPIKLAPKPAATLAEPAPIAKPSAVTDTPPGDTTTIVQAPTANPPPVTLAANPPAAAPAPVASPKVEPISTPPTVAAVKPPETPDDPNRPPAPAALQHPNPVAVAVPAEPVFNSRLMIAGSVLVLIVLIGGALVMKSMKRSRAISHASLITRSLDRTGKE
jgi:hypothetical protein